MAVLDFTAALAERQRKQAYEEAKQLMAEILSEASAAERQEIFEAIKEQDLARYKKVTEPLVIRRVMRELNDN